MERLESRESPPQSWFLDLSLVMQYWGGGAQRAYHHTAPINALYGLHEALVALHEEARGMRRRGTDDRTLVGEAGADALHAAVLQQAGEDELGLRLAAHGDAYTYLEHVEAAS